MGRMLGKFTLRLFVTLWITAVGGIIGANIAGTIGTLFFVEENKVEFIRPWWHGGWYAGTLLFFVGAATGKLKLIQGTSLGKLRTKKETLIRHSDAGSTDKLETPNVRDFAPKLSLKGRFHGVLKSFLVGGLAGSFLGVLVGGSLLVFWFSIAYSPFAPQIGSKAISKQQTKESPRERTLERRPGTRLTIRSSDRIGLSIVLVPTVLGATTGAIGLGTLAWFYPEEEETTSTTKVM